MIIRKMSASYGKLQNNVLELSPGLNIISAPNESGKSTWCSFIKSMLYGVDSSAREKNNVKPDKTLYAPWNGAPMSGSMELLHEGREISITRTGKTNAPMRELSPVLTGTAQAVPGLADKPGENLLGIPREVFERSAFIGQGSVPIGANAELEKRISAIVQTGDENLSRIDALERLRAGSRRRRHNKSGALPELERQIEALKTKKSEIEDEESGILHLKAALSRSIERCDELKKQIETAQTTKREAAINELDLSRERIHDLEIALDEQKTAAIEAEAVFRGSRFAGTTPEGMRARAARDMEQVAEIRAAQEVQELYRIRGIAGTAIFTFFAVIMFFYNIYGGVAISVFALGLFAMLLVILRKIKKLDAKAEKIFAAYGAVNTAGVFDAVSQYEALFSAYTEAAAARDLTQKTLESQRAARKEREEAILRGADRTDGAAADILRRYEEADAERSSLGEELAAREGRLGAMGTGETLSAKIAELTAEHAKLTLEYEALNLAANTLDEAGMEIQNRITPRLSACAGEIFAKLTGGRYEAVALDRKLQAAAKLSGDTLSRESGFLSAGALDQLYLAVRLAICELALPEGVPLILDDALGSFDDERCRAALLFLKEFASKRQVILFTCHSREAQMTEEFSDVNIIKI